MSEGQHGHPYFPQVEHVQHLGSEEVRFTVLDGRIRLKILEQKHGVDHKNIPVKLRLLSSFQKMSPFQLKISWMPLDSTNTKKVKIDN